MCTAFSVSSSQVSIISRKIITGICLLYTSESHICFLDEIFKANDGLLNSLLKALNEHVYTNEGVSVKIPVISFFSASNEIPNFNNPEEKSLRALYDRFDFKVCTKYVEDKANRMRVLHQKQQNMLPPAQAVISLEELYAMQAEIRLVKVCLLYTSRCV